MSPEPTRPTRGPALWNPHAAAAWSLLFSPVFGAWLHALNWRSLGEWHRQQRAVRWMLVGVAILLVYLLLDWVVPDPTVATAIARATGAAYFLAWYLGPARDQVRVVRARHGTDYRRRPWGRVLGRALGVALGYTVLAGLLASLPR